MWFKFRDLILRRHARPGWRPNLWWVYEGAPPVRGVQTQSEHLYRTIADEAERAEIERRWLGAIAHCLREHPHDLRAARRLARTWGDCPTWFFRKAVAEMAPAAPIVPMRQKRARAK